MKGLVLVLLVIHWIRGYGDSQRATETVREELLS